MTEFEITIAYNGQTSPDLRLKAKDWAEVLSLSSQIAQANLADGTTAVEIKISCVPATW
jgi:hypothetical protein